MLVSKVPTQGKVKKEEEDPRIKINNNLPQFKSKKKMKIKSQRHRFHKISWMPLPNTLRRKMGLCYR